MQVTKYYIVEIRNNWIIWLLAQLILLVLLLYFLAFFPVWFGVHLPAPARRASQKNAKGTANRRNAYNGWGCRRGRSGKEQKRAIHLKNQENSQPCYINLLLRITEYNWHSKKLVVLKKCKFMLTIQYLKYPTYQFFCIAAHYQISQHLQYNNIVLT